MRLGITVTALAMLCLTGQQARPQVITADLIADSIAYRFTAPDTIEIDAFFSFYNSFDRDSSLSSDITIFLDGIQVHWSPLDIDASEAVCREDPLCKPEMCDAIIIQGEARVINCKWGQTIPPDSFEVCVCWGGWGFHVAAPYSGETQISFALDSMDGVTEADETNNEISLVIHPIPALGRPTLVLLTLLLILAGSIIARRRVARTVRGPNLRI